MPFNFSFSSSATFVSTSSVNGQTKGYAYQRQSYSTPQGSGVRTTEQKLGQAPLTQTKLYDPCGRQMVSPGSNPGGSSGGNQANIPSRRIISIEDVTEEEEENTGH
ncbi:hypothetical protein VMCG_08768 [Cytospora schulzeri]|uniref:Uncharacterized protein n=1 Tax=Cytospora schulzeri TaxID=448051 RepID=A0A423VS12_9PEZI|nr:hypothetical protein VMCG_08768 [Valsa malicola]